ncbi:orotidine-5'-phosphate decarboxylase [Tundrisphaera lichenicola]|uniref:orotidine-5'-phosphate decarboxylase n=1 Tax=Tundrisphaera lichenicola TaxID=2029860 RepID=UPI003EBC6011
MDHFADALMAAIIRAGNPVCVGIDPRPEDLPTDFLDRFAGDRDGVALALEEFGRGIAEVVAPMVPAVKFQAAFYEAYGPEGVRALHATASYAMGLGLIVLMDGKRNDIGSTAEAYARAYLGKVPVGNQFEPSWEVDALTVNPYLGTDGISPFVKVAAREGKGIFVLVRTSNASAREFQDLVADGRPIYRHVAEKLSEWAEPHRGASGYSLVGAVVGATYPAELAELRQALPGIPFLVPGYGTQGGTASDIAPAFDDQGLGALVNNSRGIAFAYKKPAAIARFGDDWKAAVAQAVRDMADDLAAHSTTSRLRKG